MNRIPKNALWIILVLALATQAAGLAAPHTASKSFNFDIGTTYSATDKFDLPKISEGGCILAQITSWSRSGNSGSPTSELALILTSTDIQGYYARADGKAPLWISYAIATKDAERVKTWSISVANFTKAGTASGTLLVEYPATQIPCELKAAVSRTKGQVDITWKHTGKTFRGSFLVERSTDSKSWKVVSACTKSATASSYSCSEKGLTSGRLYYYRACAVAAEAKLCGKENLTPPVSVKLP